MLSIASSFLLKLRLVVEGKGLSSGGLATITLNVILPKVDKIVKLIVIYGSNGV